MHKSIMGYSWAGGDAAFQINRVKRSVARLVPLAHHHPHPCHDDGETRLSNCVEPQETAATRGRTKAEDSLGKRLRNTGLFSAVCYPTKARHCVATRGLSAVLTQQGTHRADEAASTSRAPHQSTPSPCHALTARSLPDVPGNHVRMCCATLSFLKLIGTG